MFTSHGHHIPGTVLDDTDDNQRNVARCGGPRLCNTCAVESVNFMVDLNDGTLVISDRVSKIYPYSDGEFTVLGPECFTNKEETVISYKGDNYYKACGEIVTGPRDPEANAEQTTCVLRVGHYDREHVDYVGNSRVLLTTTSFNNIVRNDARKVLSLTGLGDEEIYNALNALESEGFTLTRENHA